MTPIVATIASELPVDGIALPMSKGNFKRVEGGAVPLLLDHQNAAQKRIGNVVGVSVEGDRLLGSIEITDPEIENRIAYGERPNLSIGYDVYASKTVDGIEIADDWELLEISLVGIGLDANAGIGRNVGDTIMRTRNQPAPTNGAPQAQQPANPNGSPVVQAQQVQPQVAVQPVQGDVTAERQRTRSIVEIGKNFNTDPNLSLIHI